MKENPTLAVIGAEGFVGSSLGGIWRIKGVEIIAPNESQLDITDKEAVDKFISACPANCIALSAAWTDVDGAEKDPAKAKRINTDGARNVAAAAKRHGKFLIYFSTEFVFSGTEKTPGPYSEKAKPDINSPDIGEYARSKLGGENALKEVGGRYAIIRLAFPFGNYNSERDYIRKLHQSVKKGYGLFTDQVVTPTYIPDLGEAILHIARNEMTGIYHVGTHPPVTPYNLGKYLNEKLSAGLEVKGGKMSEYLKKPGVAPRPIKGGLDCRETQKRLGIKFHSWKDAIDEMQLSSES